ncbi:hypothetical protein QWY14_02370 [Planococcus sp. N028]|uniref:Tripartite tricarboxylate transporter TctB family protein n=1 Tax=Planococcus shixiaomingii TaxID=3058393 RepID=A0ABT8MY92_9BACL|nr:hypothetical protein [Planococcus sp. N028]MDN7240612.1 hypothetical protein [Planococcus sp. N028]
MFFNFMKGASAAILASNVTFLFLLYLTSPGNNLDTLPPNAYPFVLVSTFFGYIGAGLGIWILWLYQEEEIFSKDILAVFAAVGLLLGLCLELLTVFAVIPFFILAAFIGAMTFLAVQKIKNRIVGWSIVGIHLVLLFLFPIIEELLTLIN